MKKSEPMEEEGQLENAGNLIDVEAVLSGCVAMLDFVLGQPNVDAVVVNQVVEQLENLQALFSSYEQQFDADAYRQREMVTAALENLRATISVLNCPTSPPMSQESPSGSADRSRSSGSSGENNNTDDQALDSFADSRRRAIEATIVDNIENLPKMQDIVKTALMEAAADPILYPEWFSNTDLRPWRTILLYGPPGTGKSHLAKAIAREVDGRFFALSSSDLISSWSGQSEKLIRELFDCALGQSNGSRSPVIFIDEIDSLCRTRESREDDANRRVKTELLVQMQRLTDSGHVSSMSPPSSSRMHCIMVAATNCPWDLDAAFLRRFDKRLYVGLPDAESRVELLKRSLAQTRIDPGMNWPATAIVTDGFSGDDIRRFAREIAAQQFRRFKAQRSFGVELQLNNVQPVTMEDMCALANDFSPTVNEAMMKRYVQYSTGI